jgi:phasin family protein
MTTLSEQLSSVRKSQWEAQLDVFRALSKRALDSAEQLIALNMKTSRASVEQATGTFKQLLEVNNPRDLLALGSSAQDQWQQFFSYGRELLSIATGTHQRTWTTLPAALQLMQAGTANVPTSVPLLMEQAAIAAADATTVGSEIARAAVDTGGALAEAALDAGQQAVARTEEPAPAPAPAEAVSAALEPAAAVEQPVPASDPVQAAIADDVPPAKAKPLAKALGKAAPKPAAAEHPIASTVPLEASPQVDLPIVTPAESAQQLRVVNQGGKSSRSPRKT